MSTASLNCCHSIGCGSKTGSATVVGAGASAVVTAGDDSSTVCGGAIELAAEAGVLDSGSVVDVACSGLDEQAASASVAPTRTTRLNTGPRLRGYRRVALAPLAQAPLAEARSPPDGPSSTGRSLRSCGWVHTP